VEDAEAELAPLGRVEEAHFIERAQSGREEPRAHVDDGDLRAAADRIENFHLIADRVHVDDLGRLGMEALQRPARMFRIEGADGDLIDGEIIEQSAGDRGLADAPFVCTNENDGRFGHGALVRFENQSHPLLC